ncbi:MAG: hypothetical protein K0R17_3111 [Rariglobus sp.]|jgi:uncharacterized membrane protein|nr:hypothetical protein [Rariglobus sp.]
MKSFEERLRVESSDWVSEGLMTGEQRARLLARHPESPGGGRFVAILAAVGGGLLLAGICLLISSNWQAIGDWVKIGGLVALLGGAYLAGWRLRISPGRYPKSGDAFFMLGAGLFMAGIALVSQVFHLNSRPATGVLAWWLGIVAVPWLVRSKGAQAVSLLAFLTWLGMEFAMHGSWLSLMPEGYYSESGIRLVAIMTVLGLGVWLAGLALRGSRHEAFASLHEKWGALLVCSGLYLLGFLRHIWEWRSENRPVEPAPAVIVAVLVAVAGWGAWRASRRELLSLSGWFMAALVPVCAVLAGWNPGDHGWLWSAWAWTALFVLNVFMIRTGLATGRESWVNLGLGFIAVNIVTRYFDLFGTMMEGGVFFVISGVIVLTLGIYLERKRRGWLATMRAEKEAA